MDRKFKNQIFIAFVICSVFFTSLFFYIGDKHDKKSTKNKYDVREDGHGISIINSNAGKLLIYSYDYKKDDKWDHDVYIRNINSDNELGAERTLIQNNEAQEPVSASKDKQGNILVSFEDGADPKNNLLSQRYAIYNSNLNVEKPYPQTAEIGGHSGHVASTDSKHVIFYGEGWIKSGGVNNLGSGHFVKIYSMNGDGSNPKRLNITTNKKRREWWPLIAASNNNCFLLWQRYVNNQKYMQLCYAIYNPNTNKLLPMKKHKKIRKFKIKGKYYNYGVQYLKATNEFIVYATDRNNKGRVYLFNANGKLLDHKKIDHAFVRETTPAIKEMNNKSLVVYPTNKNSITSFEITNHKIKPGPKFKNTEIKALSHDNKELVLSKDDKNWNIRGNVGTFSDNNSVAIYSLGDNGVIIHKYDVIK